MATSKKQPQKTDADERLVYVHPQTQRPIRLRVPDLLFLQMVYNSVKMPAVPTYEVEIYGGGSQTHKMDSDFIKNGASDEQKQEWYRYLLNLGEGINEQTSRVLRATFLEGTEIEREIDDPRWYQRMRIVGLAIPDDPVERWIFYLTTSLSKEQQTELSNRIVSASEGPPEEEIQAALDSFRDSVRT